MSGDFVRKRKLRVGLISSFVPKKCGIATYSRDLIDAMVQYGNIDWRLVAAEDGKESYSYGDHIIAVVRKNDPGSYIRAAKELNAWAPDIVLLGHEYGLYGGDWVDFSKKGKKRHDPTGNYVLNLISQVVAPIVTTLHTVVSEPDEVRREVIRSINKRSSSLIAMTNDAKNILAEHYDIPRRHITVIPHGVPQPIKRDRKSVLDELGLDSNRFYLLITGLIGPNKQIDLVLKALPDILERHPEVTLLVVGQTHPDILETDGEKYRESLLRLADQLGVSQSVIFVNEYLPTSVLVDYFTIADIYLTIHKDPEQSASGTLAYALGCGLVAVSTPYRYAEEVLSDGRGFLVPFNSPAAIVKQINNLIETPALQQVTKNKAAALGRQMSWRIVSETYQRLFNSILSGL